MVLASQMILFMRKLLLSILILGSSVALAKPQACATEKTIQSILQSDSEWLPIVRIAQGSKRSSKFYPVTGIATSEGKLWVSTFHSDYSPVRTGIKAGQWEISNVRYLYAPAHVTNNKDVNAVRPYSGAATEYVLQIVEPCKGSKFIRLQIYLNGRSGGRRADETILFKKK